MDSNDRFGLRIRDIKFRDGSILQLNNSSMIVLTGPNNSGKSQTIKEIYKFYNNERKIVQEINYDICGDKELIWKEFIQKSNFAVSQHIFKSQLGSNFEGIEGLIRQFKQDISTLNFLMSRLCTYISTVNRLFRIHTTPYDDDYFPLNGTPPIPPELKQLYEDELFEDKFFKAVSDAFGRGVIIDKHTFQSHKLHFLDVDERNKLPDQRSTQFAKWFSERPLLDRQGDGVRSFCAVLLSVMAGQKPLILIDEPEAFLHPPQARDLARAIGQNADESTQIIMATHSADFLQALLDFSPERVSVVRLSRPKQDILKVTKVHYLDSNEIKDLWKDPLLKISDALSALFHDAAVLVEGDSDARFFRLVFESMNIYNAEEKIDLRFYHCGGKPRIYKIASSLRAINIPVIAIVDIDILDDWGNTCRLVKSFGGDPLSIKTNFENMSKVIRSNATLRTKSEIINLIETVLQRYNSHDFVDAADLENAKPALRLKSPWRDIKSKGSAYFKENGIEDDFNEVINYLESLGILINKVGELENYDKSIVGRKDSWLDQVIKKDIGASAELAPARAFMSKVVERARRQQVP